ncbi:MAG TPA: bifunctional 4-hydroxy-3-methylbut-2-enyl diphosphate reductase/30S ribosomal protein S1 [Eubacteriaceae bacterium]|nr:bifunctional 4-hydroxy-3-methylbut-2-enyl diphosphate reductase/30S ribosomal protein S1 [Eubacteriaceae bacterium]
MEIYLAKSAGYCYGVQNAINMVEKSIRDSKINIYTLGHIIHNRQVIEKLESQGVYSIDKIEDINDGTIIIRSHGVQPNIYEKVSEKNLVLVDATCPYVKNIQKKVERYYQDNYQIIIIGDEEHPEVIGVNGWCNNSAIILNDIEQVKKIPNYKKICIVAQTTIVLEKFLEIVSRIVSKAKEIIIFNTICDATKNRQDEAANLAKKVDVMIVIGGYHSSNTQKLVSISKEYCKNVFHVETYRDLPIVELIKYNKIGITAGASTPNWIIKEVISKMENEFNKEEIMPMDFEKSIEESMVKIKPGDIVFGEVISISEEDIIVNIGYKSDGKIIKSEFTMDKDSDLKDLIQIGDKIELEVLSLNDGEGYVALSKKRVDDKKATKRLNEIFENQEIISGKIKKSIKGGFIVDIGIKDVFMPISHYHIRFIKDPESVVGQSVKGIIIEYNPERNKIIFSQKIVLEREISEKKEKIFNSIEVGDKISGKVKSIVKFGAFIDLGGIDGMIHVSDLSWQRVNHPEDVLSIGDTIEAMVMEVDKEKERIKLSLKHLVENPWEKVFKLYSIGDKVNVKIVKTTSFGAFAEIIKGVEGLIHKSQISFENIDNVEEHLSIGQEVETEIIDMDKEKKKIGLSMISFQDKPIKKIELNETVYKEDDDLTLGDVFGKLFK